MAFQLRDELHWCDCAGRAVFLDVAADRYFCLPKTANDAFLRLAAADMKPGDIGHLEMLLVRGLLIEAPQGTRLRPPPQIDNPTSDLVAEPMRSGLLPIARALASQLHVASRLRARSFEQVIATALKPNPHDNRARRKPSQSLQVISAAAGLSAFLFRAHNRCLVRALSVHALCHRIGIRPNLVFGVIAHPFAAHCWVQLGTAVLVGGFEQARLYTPILVLE